MNLLCKHGRRDILEKYISMYKYETIIHGIKQLLIYNHFDIAEWLLIYAKEPIVINCYGAHIYEDTTFIALYEWMSRNSKVKFALCDTFIYACDHGFINFAKRLFNENNMKMTKDLIEYINIDDIELFEWINSMYSLDKMAYLSSALLNGDCEFAEHIATKYSIISETTSIIGIFRYVASKRHYNVIKWLIRNYGCIPQFIEHIYAMNVDVLNELMLLSDFEVYRYEIFISACKRGIISIAKILYKPEYNNIITNEDILDINRFLNNIKFKKWFAYKFNIREERQWQVIIDSIRCYSTYNRFKWAISLGYDAQYCINGDTLCELHMMPYYLSTKSIDEIIHDCNYAAIKKAYRVGILTNEHTSHVIARSEKLNKIELINSKTISEF